MIEERTYDPLSDYGITMTVEGSLIKYAYDSSKAKKKMTDGMGTTTIRNGVALIETGSKLVESLINIEHNKKVDQCLIANGQF